MATAQIHGTERPPSKLPVSSRSEESQPAVDSGSRTGEPSSLGTRHVAGHEWAPIAFLLFLDVSCWFLIHATISAHWGDLLFASRPLDFFLVDAMQLVVIVQAIFIIGGYSYKTAMRSLTYTAEHILAMAGALAVSSLLIYVAATFNESLKPSRGVFLLSFIAFTAPSILYRRALSDRIASSAARRAFLVIGSGKMAAEFYEEYQRSSNRQQLEFVDPGDQRIGERIAGAGSPAIQGNCPGKLTNLGQHYSGVILAEKVECLGKDLIEKLARTQFQRTRVYTLESFYEAHWRHVPLNVIDPVWPLQMGFQLASSSPYHYLKRLFDLALSIVLLVIFTPLLVLIPLAIWMTSGRPAAFRQQRIGLHGHPFTAYKFRTMVTCSPDQAADIYTRKNDPRVTRLGRWLRQLRLDELPQLFNVFRGEMSLIGPRAEWVRCAERYEKAIPFYHFRHLVRPGITGWAQVNYPYGESDEDALEKLKYDLYYIRRYSLTLDAMIVLKTVHTMLFSKGR